MSLPREVVPSATYLITRRAILRHMLLRPDKRMTQIALYLVAVTARRYGIEVHAICAMSTHIHLVVTDVRGVLPSFLHAFHRTIALCIKVLRGWNDVVWDKQPTSVVRLETPAAIVEKIAYVLANPVAAGLVRHAHEWPGAKVLTNEIGRGTLRARRPDVYLDPKNPLWPEEATLPIALPPRVAPEQAEAFREQVAAELSRLEASAHAHMQEQGRRFLGAEQASRVAPETRATSVEPVFDRQPRFATGRGQADAYRRAAATLRAFRASYRSAIERWRAGVRGVLFPAGTWWMRIFHGACVNEVVAARAG
jgi:REP element-mobilizing transposase RayT